jgi:sulfate transport system permease protein
MTARPFTLRNPTPMPGWGLSFGIMVTMLSVIVLIPMAVLLWRGFIGFGAAEIWEVVNRPRVWSALELSFRAALVASLFNLVFGVILAWVLVRYRFPGKRILDAAIDLPIALPTAVAGIALAVIYAPNGWIGGLLAPLGIKIGYTPFAVVLALIFVGLPFVVRTLQPVLAESEKDIEEAAALLGASRLRTVFSVVLPLVTPALLTGFALAFARGVGEYGSVIFVAGNLPLISEIAPLLIVIRLEEFDYAGAAVIATVMLALSFTILLLIGALQVRNRRRLGYA